MLTDELSTLTGMPYEYFAANFPFDGGQYGLAIELEGALNTIYTADIENGRIARLFILRNPDKLERAEAALKSS